MSFNFLYKFFSKPFLILRRNKPDVIISVHRSSCIIAVILARFLSGNSVIDSFIFSSQVTVHVLDFCFFTNDALFHFRGQINSQTSRAMSAENPPALRENPLHSSKSVFSQQCVKNDLWCQCSLKRLTENNFTICCNYKLFVTFLLSLKK